MDKKTNFHASFSDFRIIENKITGFYECIGVSASRYSSFKSFTKCHIIQTTEILPQIFNLCPQITGSKWGNI